MNNRSRQSRLLGLSLGLLALLAVSSIGAAAPDWLIDPSPFKARVAVSADGRDVALENGLVRRVVRLVPNAATIAYDNLITGESMIRSVRPEAQVEIDGAAYDVGGLTGQPVHNYLDAAWVERLEAQPGAFRFTRFSTGQTKERFPWKKRLEWMPQDLPWPAPGVSLTLEFTAPNNFALAIDVHYELFDGLPLLSKWIVVRNASDKPVA